MSRRIKLSAVLTAAVALAVGGVAYATIPDSGDRIHGCFSPVAAGKNGGTELKVIDSDVASCGKGQREVIWNQQGPAGAQGPQGPQGLQGPKGDPGDSGAGGVLYTLSEDYPENDPVYIEGTPAAVASLDLAAGSYLVLADVGFNGEGLFCSIGQDGTLVAGSTAQGGTIQMFEWVTLGEAGTIEIWCERPPLRTDIQTVVERRIAALEVAIG